MRRLDDVAVGMLRDLLGAIVSGHAHVVSVQAEEDEDHALAVRWVPGSAPMEETAAKAERGPKPCPSCGHGETWLTQHNTMICPSCGYTAIL